MIRWIVIAAALLGWSAPAAAQFGLRAAEGTTSLIQSGSPYTVLAVDTKDESLNLVYRSGVFGRRQEWFDQAKLSLSADGGDRDLFAGGRFVPGVRVQNRIAWSDFGADADDAGDDDGDQAADGVPQAVGGPAGFTALFASFAYEMKSNSMAQLGGATGDELVLDDRTGHTLSVGGGVNWARDVTGSWWGVSADVKWGWNVPISSRTSQVCFTQSTALSGGQPAVVSRCGARYFSGVHNNASAHLRLDWQSPYLPRITQARVTAATTSEQQQVVTAQDLVNRRTDDLTAANQRRTDAATALAAAWSALSADPANPGKVQAVAHAQAAVDAAGAEVRTATSQLDQAKDALTAAKANQKKTIDALTGRNTVTLLAALSSDLTEGDRPRYNLAVGPSLHPGLKPLNVVGALLFEMSDLTGSSDWRDRFSVRLYLGVPFGGGGLR